MNDSAIIEFFKGALGAARSDAKASEYMQQWSEAASDQSWWRAEDASVSPRQRITSILVALHPIIKAASAKPRAPREAKAPSEAKPKPEKRYAGVAGSESKDFDNAWDAHKWVVRTLAEAVAGSTGEVRDRVNPRLSVSVEQDRATRIANRVGPSTATRTVGGKAGSGPWMKASQSRSHTSKG